MATGIHGYSLERVDLFFALLDVALNELGDAGAAAESRTGNELLRQGYIPILGCFLSVVATEDLVEADMPIRIDSNAVPITGQAKNLADRIQ